MTAIAWPFVEWLALTSSQLDACGGPESDCRNSCDPIDPSLGTSCGAGVWLVAWLDDAVRAPATAKPTEPGTGIPSPFLAKGEPVSYLNALETVTGASGSLCS